MHGFFFPVKISIHGRKESVILLAFVWVAGLFLGTLTVAACDDATFALVRAYSRQQVLASALLAVSLFPLAVTLISCFLARHVLLFLLAFAKAFLLSFVMVSVALCWQQGGWLVSLVLLGGDFLSVPVLLWLWIRILAEHPVSLGFLGFSVVVPVLACYLEYQFLAPFLTRIVTM